MLYLIHVVFKRSSFVSRVQEWSAAAELWIQIVSLPTIKFTFHANFSIIPQRSVFYLQVIFWVTHFRAWANNFRLLAHHCYSSWWMILCGGFWSFELRLCYFIVIAFQVWHKMHAPHLRVTCSVRFRLATFLYSLVIIIKHLITFQKH